jgi:hypothetical protein
VVLKEGVSESGVPYQIYKEIPVNAPKMVDLASQTDGDWQSDAEMVRLCDPLF